MELIFLLVLSSISMYAPLEGPSNQSAGTIPTTDGGLVAIGSIYRSDGVVIKLSANGTQEWITLFSGRGLVSSIQEIPGEGYIIAGYSPFISIHRNPRGWGWIAKLRPNGTVQWKKTLNNGFYSELHSIIVTKDGNYLTVGLIGTGDSEDGLVVKFDKNGTSIWYKIYGDETTEVFEDVKETGPNEFMIFGYRDGNPMIVVAIERDDQIDIRSLF